MRFETLPVNVTQQRQDGCVTASARSFISNLGIPFDGVFLPRLKEYSLDESNPENNHMLGVAVVAANLGLAVSIHRATPLESDVLPENAPARAKLVHPQVVKKLMDFRNSGKVEIDIGLVDQKKLEQLLTDQFSNGRYGLVILDWGKWNVEAQKKFGNPRHIISVLGLNDHKVSGIDPSLPEQDNPISVSVDHLYRSLNEKQQMIFIGKGN